ncbi:type II toxin-antitoxin system VapC family toxin [Brevundimonas sp.]|uniref:type II toxin-antitoxin system VapC family toxin n=1 Tax=Brevundimonas sp. TaxID=1871086 RepID=UPI00272FCFAE|nr:PIN domain-containing protein [Brevundimonas sp.]MDP1912220.1 PIN domain-containing protein [Brevundimonas sp.]
MLLDTGFLVSLFDRRERLHAAATAWLSGQLRPLWSVPSVLVEAAHFLPGWLRPALARTVASGVVSVAAPDAAAYGRIAVLLDKYADLDADWADIELVWLAETTGIQRIATLDVADFGVYRIHGRKRFDIVWPR